VANTHDIPLDAIASHNVTLTPNVVESFRFPDNVAQLEILSDGASDIYFTVDGTTPTIGHPKSYRIQSVMGSTIMTPTASGPTFVKMISEGTPNVSVGRTNA
jgi:hypothetical protein